MPLISNGGLVTLVTLCEKKNAAFLDNISKLIDQWQEVPMTESYGLTSES